MDAITLLREDHRDVEKLFKRFEKAGDRAHVEKRQIVDRIIEALSVHAAIEEQVFYPVARATVDGVEDITLESLEEHHVVKWTLSELDKMDPEDERFDAKVTVLIESVRHHVKEEEEEFFPKVRADLGRRALADLGDALAEAKSSAPTKPHPRSPDTPPANAVVGAVSGVLDRVGDNISGLAQGGMAALQDLIAQIRGTQKPRTRPTGSSTARRRASGVRKAAGEATSGAARTARKAASGARDTAKTARSGAKATGTTARKSAKATATTAKRATTGTRRRASKAAGSTAKSATRTAKATAKAARSS